MGEMEKRSKSNFTHGVATALPLVIGYLPIAVSFGVIARNAGIPLLQTILMSALVYAGASQFMAVNMIVAGAGGLEIVTATFVLNLRHLIMSLSLMHLWDKIPKAWKAGFAFGITDETFAITSLQGEGSTRDSNRSFLAGLLLTAYGAWVGGTLLGGLLAGIIPPTVSESMAIGLYAMFIGLLVPAVRPSWRAGVVAVGSMGLCTLFYQIFDSGWAVVLATVVGAGIGVAIFGKEERE